MNACLLLRRRATLVLLPLTLATLGAAWVEACIPEFVQLLPHRPSELREPIPLMLSTELQSLTLASPLAPDLRKVLSADAQHQHSDPYETRDQLDQRQLKAQREGLPASLKSTYDAAKASAHGEAAEASAAALPTAWRLYAAAAADARQQNTEAARQRFERLLALPAGEARPMAVWAAYSLGRLLRASDAAAATKAFAEARRWRAQGAPDPLGLAVDSLGEEAAMHLAAADEVSETAMLPALRLYFEQARLGSESGLGSLRQLQHSHLDQQPKLLQQLLALDWGQAMLVRLAADSPSWYDDKGALKRYQQLVATMTAMPGLSLDEPERWAALAWKHGDLKHARAWLGASPRTAIGAWTQAKVALADAKPDLAAQWFASAVKLWPAQAAADNAAARHRLLAEQGLLQLQRGELTLGLRALVAAGDTYALDAAFVAERLLTSAELRTVIDELAPATSTDAGRQRLRHLLARRLMREGQFADAFTYFPTHFERQRWVDVKPVTETHDLSAQAREYAAAVARADKAWTRVGRAEALMQAGHLARQYGWDLMAFELGADSFATEGGYELREASGDDEIGSPRSAAESGRLSQPQPTLPLPPGFAPPKPLPRFHYRYVAAQHALQAADLVPARSQAFASSLCHAVLWVGARDEAFGRTAWERYVREGAHLPWATRFGWACEEPDFSGARRLQAKQWMHRTLPWLFHHPRRSAALALTLVAALAGWWWWRTRCASPAQPA